MRAQLRNIFVVVMISLVVYVTVASHRATGALPEIASPHFLWGALFIALILLRDLLGPRAWAASDGRRGFAFQDRPLLFGVCVTFTLFLLLALGAWSIELHYIHDAPEGSLLRRLATDDIDLAPLLFVISALLLLVKDLGGEARALSDGKMGSFVTLLLLLVPGLVLPAALHFLLRYLNLVTIDEVSLVWSVALLLLIWEGIRARAEARRPRQLEA